MSISPLHRHSPFAGGTPTLLDEKSRPFRIGFEMISGEIASLEVHTAVVVTSGSSSLRLGNKEHGRPACAEPITTQEAHQQSTKLLT